MLRVEPPPVRAAVGDGVAGPNGLPVKGPATTAGAPEARADTLGAPLRVRHDGSPSPTNAWQRIQRSLYERSPLLRSAAFRTAVSFWFLFAVCTVIAGYSFYETVQRVALDKLDDSLLDKFTDISTIYAAQDLDGVIEIGELREAGPMAVGIGFHLAAPNGRRLLGNLDRGVEVDGFRTLRGADVGLDDTEGYYRFYAMPLGDNRLTIGRSLESLEELRTIALNCLLMAFAMSMVLSILAASWIMRRSHRRMQAFGDALDRVADGNFSARVPVTFANDDVDTMAIAVNAALARLDGNIDSLRQVSTDIAHDLKTPLNRLYILLDEAASRTDALDDDAGAAAIGSALEDAIGEAEHINTTFEALLRVAQIEAGSRRANFKHFDLAETLATACEIYAPVVEEACAALEVRFDPDIALPMYGDRELVLQLTVNLIENAIRHGCAEAREQGRQDVTIAVEAGLAGGQGGAPGDERVAGSAGDQVWLAVVDDGPGIPEAEREKVFQRLYRLERSRTTRGTGLGLSLVKAIADLHCGTVMLGDNEPGLRFRVEFDRDCPLEKARHRPS